MDFTPHNKSELIEEYILKDMLPKLGPDTRLPSELELSKQLGTSRPTIHKILSNLTSQGLLYRRNGIGTFVSRPQSKEDTIVAVLAHPADFMPTQSCFWFVEQFMVDGLSRRAAKDGIGLQLAHLHPEDRSYDETVSLLLKMRAKAYFFLEFGGYAEIVKRLLAAGAVCIVRGPVQYDFTHCVFRRIKEGVEEGVGHLIASGCRRIAHFSFPLETSFYEQLRFKGYKDALDKAGIPLEQSLVRVCGGFSHEAAAELKRMIDEGVKFDAVFTGTDMRAIGIMQALKVAHLRIPDDVSVLGSDNLPECLAQTPQLSTVAFDYPQLGEAMYEVMLEAQSKPGKGFVSRALEAKVITRGTTRNTEP